MCDGEILNIMWHNCSSDPIEYFLCFLDLAASSFRVWSRNFSKYPRTKSVLPRRADVSTYQCDSISPRLLLCRAAVWTTDCFVRISFSISSGSREVKPVNVVTKQLQKTPHLSRELANVINKTCVQDWVERKTTC